MTSMIGVRGAVVCPSASSISPCTCSAAYFDPNGLNLDCFNLGLSDSAMSSILDVFFNSNEISPLVQLYAPRNNLTEIPSQISKFNSIQKIDLNNNQITSIPSGSFSVPSATSVDINLSSNQITSIPSDAFNFPSATFVSIDLYSNQILRRQ